MNHFYLFYPNLRTESATATTGYTWGKPASQSNILRIIGHANYADFMASQEIANDTIVAERWLVSDDRQFPSQVQVEPETELQDWYQVLTEQAVELLGEKHVAVHGPYLGCVMKQLDTNATTTKGSLSVQVHPLPGHPNRPAKPEMWKGQGQIYLGWQHDVTPDEIRAACEAGTLEELMNAFELTPEKLVLVEGGTIHAIRYNTFTAEWSMAPGKDDQAKGNLKDATVSPYDRTDGKTPRPGKEDVEATIKLLDESNGMQAKTESELLTQPQELMSDQAGNSITQLFRTKEVYVDQVKVASELTLDMKELGRGVPIYLEQGQLEIIADGYQPLMLTAGQESFLPYSAGQVILKNTSQQPALGQYWYAPFDHPES